jgi:hypothetical protein
MNRNVHVFNRAAVQTATRRHYYQQRPPVIRRAPVVIQRAGPAFALIVPTKIMIETQPPESGLHPHVDYEHDVVALGTEAVLLLVVVLVIVAGKVVGWVVRATDGKRIL